METSTNEGASGGCDLLEDLSPSLRWFRLIGKKSIVTTDGPIAKPWKRLLSHKTRQLGLTNAAVASREAPPLLCVVENTLLKFKFSVGGGGGGENEKKKKQLNPTHPLKPQKTKKKK